MKRLLLSISIALGLILQYGCEGVLEKTPDSQITIDKILTNYNQSKGLIDVAYNAIYLSRDQISFVMSPIEC